MSNSLEKLECTGKTVTVIPATKSLHPERDGVTPLNRKKRVAAYCRVSTLLEEQQGSYDMQQAYYEAMIKSHDDWELVGIYGDEGKSGTSLKGRTGFLTMMDDVRAGKIDYIIAKATSRFGRNNSEFIAILDELDSYGVEVLFESEGIFTSGKHDRTLLQIMGVANEHYSSTLSNNVRWSKERSMRKGKVVICYKSFLGYKKGVDGNPEIVEEEAKIVRQIYTLFLEGKPYAYIARYLNEQGIPTPTGKTDWKGNIVKSILTNEKYTGDALLQKTFKRNYLDKKQHKNDGELPQVLVENNHPAIIDKATFAKVQKMVKARKDRHNYGTTKDPFVGRVICSDCGSIYGHKTWHSRGRIKYSMWVCNKKYSEENVFTDDRCKAANIREEWLEQGYLYAINQLLGRKSQIMGKYDQKLKRIDARLNSGDIENELRSLVNESKAVDKTIDKLKIEWEFSFGNHDDINKKMETHKAELRTIARRTKELETERDNLNINKKAIQIFMEAFEAMHDKIKRFNGNDFISTIDTVIVDQFSLTFLFYGGESVKIKIEELKKMCY